MWNPIHLVGLKEVREKLKALRGGSLNDNQKIDILKGVYNDIVKTKTTDNPGVFDLQQPYKDMVPIHFNLMAYKFFGLVEAQIDKEGPISSGTNSQLNGVGFPTQTNKNDLYDSMIKLIDDHHNYLIEKIDTALKVSIMQQIYLKINSL